MNYPATDLPESLDIVRTFLGTFFHENADVVGTTRALEYMFGNPEYREQVAAAFCKILGSASNSELVDLVREWANRDVVDAKTAKGYLIDLYIENCFLMEQELPRLDELGDDPSE